ncbi:MAG: hypothetical protein HRU41_03045 [Saprospiraceae bacterium]|nr:hypothetical protein [Saprospiraceae bacterium]
MKIKMIKSISMLVVALFTFSWGTAQKTSVEVTFVDHLTAGLIEQDVFVKKGSKKVYRVTPEEREQYLDAEIYSTKKAQDHDPFDIANGGPFKKGQSFGMTLGEWLKASGSATCTCDNGWGEISAEFKNLMPNAVYTMWHSFMAKPPTVPFIGTLDTPLGNRDGSQSIFKTDEQGSASLNVKFENCLQLTDEQLMSLLAIGYHSDGQTYGVLPGPFGQVTHIQLFAVLPEEDTVEEITAGKR